MTGAVERRPIAVMKISVAMCTFNGQRFLKQQLQSLLDQERQPDELVVCDDDSTDKTVQILEAFRRCSPFPLSLHRNSRRLGYAKNFSKAISLCTGDVIFPCDQDDVWRGAKISAMSTVFERDAQVGLVACDSELVGDRLQPLGRTHAHSHRFTTAFRHAVEQGRAFETFVRIRIIPGHAMALRSIHRGVVLPVPAGWMHDQWMAVVVAALSRIVLLPNAWVCYRQHGDQSLGGQRRGLLQWWRSAPTLPAEHFLSQAKQFEALEQRLRAFQDRLLDAESTRALLTAKIDFLHSRSRMRRSLLLRWPLIMSQLLRGRYHRLAQGWLTLARDLVG